MDSAFAPSQIETWPLDRLRPYARNAKIAASMATFGLTVPCMVADDGDLVSDMPVCWLPGRASSSMKP